MDARHVRVAHVAHAGRAVGELDEGLAAVGLLVERVYVGGRAVGERDVAGDHLALVERHEVRREGRGHARAERGELLVDLGHVAVAPDAVGGDVLVGLDEVRGLRRSAPRAGDPGLRVDDDVADRARSREWRERQQRRGRVAARIGHQLRAGELVAVQLRQAVDRLGEQLARRVLDVPALVDVGPEQDVIGVGLGVADAGGVRGRIRLLSRITVPARLCARSSSTP